MFSLHLQWLGEFDVRQKHVATAVIELKRLRTIEIHVLAENCPSIDALVINGYLVFSDVVIDDHFPGTDYNHFSDLLRVEPTNVDVGNDLSRILQIKKNNIIDSILHIGHALSGNRDRFWVSKPILDDADVMGRKIPERIDIGANTAKIQALAVNIADFTQLARIDELLHIPDGR